MTLTELENELAKLKLHYHHYSLHGGYLEDGICLSDDYDDWKIYHCERVAKTVIGIFPNESDACEGMFCQIKKYSDYERWF